MGDENKELDITIRAKDEASGVVNSAFENLRHKAKELNTEARASGDVALERLLKGGGFLGIFTLAGEALHKMTEEAVKLSEEFEEGKINAADIGMEIGKSLPVLGGVFEAGENINELITHQKEEIKHITEDIKAGNEMMELRVKLQKEAVKAEEDLADRARKAREALAVAQATPDQKKNVEGAGKLADIAADRDKAQKEFAEKRNEDANKEIESIKKAGEARRKVLEDDVRAAHSDWEGDSDEDNQRILEEKLSAAGRQADVVMDRQLNAATDRAKKEIAEHNAGLADLATTQRKTVIAEGVDDEAKEGIEKFKKFLEEKARALKEHNEEKEKAEKVSEEQSGEFARLEEEKRQAEHDAEAHHAEVQKTLQDEKISSLENEGRLGNIAAEREAERLKVLQQFEDKRQHILELMEKASGVDRESLSDDKSRLEAQQKIALDALSMIQIKPQIEALSHPNQYAGFEDFRKTHGIMDAQRERDRGRAQTQIQHLKDIKSGIDQLNQKIPEIPATIFAGGNSDTFDSEFT